MSIEQLFNNGNEIHTTCFPFHTETLCIHFSNLSVVPLSISKLESLSEMKKIRYILEEKR